jgi:EmrB/QacA subfamily drug resistance transporter
MVYPRRWLALPVVLLATFMAAFDYMVVNVATPTLARELHAGQAALEMVIGGYGFTYASGMVTGGRLGDLFGHRRIFVLGMAGFAVASLLCGLAETPAELVAGRLLQGLGAAAMAPQVLGLITILFPAEERARALSWFGVVLGIGGISGQVFGGLLLDANLFGLGWRTLFLVNVPVAVAAVALVLWLLPAAARSERRPRLDLVGAAGVSASVALLLVPLVLGREAGWPLWGWVSVAASVPVLAFTLWWERRVPEPLVDLSLFANRSFSVGLGVNVAFMATMGSFMLMLTLLLQSGLGLDARAAGLAFVPMGALSMVTSLLGRRLMRRYGRRALVVAAFVNVFGLGVLVLELGLDSSITAPWLLLPSGLFGLGAGIVLPLVMGEVLTGVSPSRAGAASGVLTTSQQFAGAAGVAALGTVFFAVLGSHPHRAAFVSAAATTASVDLALAVGVLALILLLPHAARPSETAVNRTPAQPDETTAVAELPNHLEITQSPAQTTTPAKPAAGPVEVVVGTEEIISGSSSDSSRSVLDRRI